jgi:hypothetical protein
MGVLSRKVKSRSRAATLLRGVFESIAASEVYITAALLESPSSKTASLLLEKCAQVSLELTAQFTPFGDRPSPTANGGRSRVCPSGSSEGMVVVIMMTALVGAEFPVVPFVTICAQLTPVGDRPSPTPNDGISRVCPSGSGEGWLW